MELEGFQSKLVSDGSNNGDFIRASAGGNDGSLNSPEYLITNWEHFDKFDIYKFCSFL